jgi:hypothetical protein
VAQRPEDRLREAVRRIARTREAVREIAERVAREREAERQAPPPAQGPGGGRVGTQGG